MDLEVVGVSDGQETLKTPGVDVTLEGSTTVVPSDSLEYPRRTSHPADPLVRRASGFVVSLG